MDESSSGIANARWTLDVVYRDIVVAVKEAFEGHIMEFQRLWLKSRSPRQDGHQGFRHLPNSDGLIPYRDVLQLCRPAEFESGEY